MSRPIADDDEPSAVALEASAERLARLLGAAIERMQLLARACARKWLSAFDRKDLTSFRRETAALAGIRWAGPGAPE